MFLYTLIEDMPFPFSHGSSEVAQEDEASVEESSESGRDLEMYCALEAWLGKVIKSKDEGMVYRYIGPSSRFTDRRAAHNYDSSPRV